MRFHIQLLEGGWDRAAFCLFPTTKTRFVQTCPYYKTLDYTSALRTAKHCIAMVTWAWSPARTLGLVPGSGACVWGRGGAWSGAWAVALDWAWLGTYLVCPGWCLRWLASARPPGHGISQSFHTKVLEEFVFEASRAAMAHEISNPSVRKVPKGSLRRLREGMRPREFPSESVARIRF